MIRGGSCGGLLEPKGMPKMDHFDYTPIVKVDTEHLRDNAARARTLLAMIMPAVIEVGEIVIDSRDRIPHGFFQTWCNAALGIDHRSALNYSNLAKLARKHGRERVEKLSITAAYRLAAPSTPAGVVTEVLDSVAAGNVPTAKQVKNLIRETRGNEAPRGAGKRPTEEIEALSGLLSVTLEPSGLDRLRSFLIGASPQSIQELCRRLEAYAPGASRVQDNAANHWMLTS
jgi:hypothetical protein